MKSLMRNADRILSGILTLAFAFAIVALVFGPSASIADAQSTKRGGSDVPVTPFEQWFKRIGFLNANGGCDVALEYDSSNVARVTDCTDAANLRDLHTRGVLLGGVPGSTQGSASTQYEVSKKITGLADATFVDLFTVTVPNASHGATIALVLHGVIGAGGAVGAGECSATAYGQVVVARTAGVAAVATAVALSNTGSACVAGATTAALTYQVTAMTGANSAQQTFTIQAKLTKGTGSSTNHVVFGTAEVLNVNDSGITVS